MIKKLPTDEITNELRGSSVFFQPNSNEQAQDTDDLEPIQTPSQNPKNPPLEPSKLPRSHDAVQPRHRDTTTPSNHETVPSLGDKATEAAMMEELRKTVKQLGKEAATHRFTIHEKATITDIVYTYGRQGVKTSENELTRIAVNWLLLDYQRHGARSVLARLLESLHG